jgi:hypothetical protein
MDLGKAHKVKVKRCSCGQVVSLKEDYCILEYAEMKDGSIICAGCEADELEERFENLSPMAYL